MTFAGSMDDCEFHNDKLVEIDYLNEDNKLEVPSNTRKIRIAFKCYSEAQNTIMMNFKYTFT